MANDFHCRIDDKAVREIIARFEPAESRKLLRKAMTKAGAAMKRVERSAIPVGATGNLRRSLSARRIKSNPAIGVVVGPMGRLGSHRHLVAGGTKPHLIRPKPPNRYLHTPFGSFGMIHHPGARPNRWLDRVDSAAYNAGHDAAETVIDEALR